MLRHRTPKRQRTYRGVIAETIVFSILGAPLIVGYHAIFGTGEFTRQALAEIYWPMTPIFAGLYLVLNLGVVALSNRYQAKASEE